MTLQKTCPWQLFMNFLPDHKIFLIFPKEALLFFFIFLCSYALIAFPVYS